jgi:hypothetical protein
LQNGLRKYVCTTVQLKETRDVITTPVKITIQGEELVWDLHYKLQYDEGYDYRPSYRFKLNLECVTAPLETISYDLDILVRYPEYNNRLRTRRTGKWYRLYIEEPCVVFKIELEEGRPREQLQIFRRLYEDESSKDVEVHCGEEAIRAHKFVVNIYSDTLRAAFSHEGLVEGRTGIYRWS